MGEDAYVDLYWLPLGAGGHCVRWNGRVYEAVIAGWQHRSRCDLYHCALQVRAEATTYAIEMGPVWNVTAADRGVVCEGPVGSRALGRFAAFRYEVRCWPAGRIPDLDEAVGEPQRVTTDAQQARAVMRAVALVPALTWGRDERGLGEMWNSNSVVSWALATAGQDASAIRLPQNGRAPGWLAGLRLAATPATPSGPAPPSAPAGGA
ncbi:MAG TPA: hypothetical protein VHO27_03230 [Angustibacter sp.]|nr:hypothetical protein [Angustibacter sp.]